MLTYVDRYLEMDTELFIFIYGYGQLSWLLHLKDVKSIDVRDGMRSENAIENRHFSPAQVPAVKIEFVLFLLKELRDLFAKPPKYVLNYEVP